MYCKMYTEIFDDNIPHYEKVDYVSLQKKIVDKLRNMNPIDRQHTEVILKDNLHEFKDGGTDFKQFYGAMIAFFTGIASAYWKTIMDKGSQESLSILTAMVYGITFFILYFMTVEVIFNNRKIVKSGFYEWCLNLLDKFENAKFDVDVNTNEALNQIAATIETQKQDEQVKRSPHKSSGNWNVEINMKSIFDSIEGIYRVGKFIIKGFKKKK